MRTRRLVLFVLTFVAVTSQAWVYPEHRSIAITAIEKLEPEYRALLDQLWAEARQGHEGRLTSSVIDVQQGRKPDKLDYAAWMGIAGDHSCSPKDMLSTVLESDWILHVADVAARLQIDLKNAKKADRYVNAIRNSDIRLQRADEDYATRAGSNNVHFLLARTSLDQDSLKYMLASLAEGAELNAAGAYSWYHTLAMLKAIRYAGGQVPEGERSALILGALADEAFGLHFLEDIFAAGHAAGTWGNASMRKGTHDYYNENGLEVVTWNGKRYVLMGDAYMTAHDEQIAADALVLSFKELLDAASGKLSFENKTLNAMSAPDTFNVCKNNYLPKGDFDFVLLRSILRTTPVPGLASGRGSVPRFRAEIGPFVGASAVLVGSTINGGFGEVQNKAGVIGGLEANVRVGLGLDGVLNQAGDGLVFLQFGWRQDAASSSQFTNRDSNFPANTITSTIPGRSGYNMRLRLPFWLIPGDLILAAPFLGIGAPKTFQKMAVTAANGGVIPWQSGIATPIGRFQFVLGREIGVSIYGLGETVDAILIPQSNTTTYLVSYRSAKFDFPFLEYSPFSASFSQKQSSSLLLQFSVGTDVPYHESVLAPAGNPSVKLKPVGYFSTRLIFNWRRYF